jgi:VIT1/CCC1 family predicted Fe2+/Mn2+ transporter
VAHAGGRVTIVEGVHIHSVHRGADQEGGVGMHEATLGRGDRAEPIPRRSETFVQRAALREILMGAQDNLTNVLSVMLGVSVGAGRADLVALAGVSAAVAEAVSMGGVLYSSTRAERLNGIENNGLTAAQSGVTCFAAALVAGLVPLAPFVFLPLPAAAILATLISLTALFALGSWTGTISGVSWWRDGVRLLAVACGAALAAALVGTMLRVG